MISKVFEYNREFFQVLVITTLLVFAIVCVYVIFFEPNEISPNEQTLNAYAAFESTCSYRGYDRDECLLIWSGR